MKFSAVDGNYAVSGCGRYTISRAPALAQAVSGCDMTYSLWFGKEPIAVERCKNFVADRTEAIAWLTVQAEKHAAGATA